PCATRGSTCRYSGGMCAACPEAIHSARSRSASTSALVRTCPTRRYPFSWKKATCSSVNPLILLSSRMARSFQPAIQPFKGFRLHRRVEFVSTGIQRKPESLRRSRPRIDLGQYLPTDLDLRRGEQRVFRAV